MVVCTGRNLGQMGYGKHLPRAPELLHEQADWFCYRPIRVHFVENEGLRAAHGAGGNRDGQRDA